MIWSAATIIALIQEGVVLLPKLQELLGTIRGSFSSTDMAAIDAALAAAIKQDEIDTAQADADLDAAAKRT
jgi:hypothetical protein